jgi:putative membrane protein
MIKEFIVLVLKGAGMGAANVIPGVSGGTIALITGIFEKLIDSIKSFNLKALKLLFTGKFKEFANHINLGFLIAVFLGIGISIITFARLLDYLFLNYPIYIWSFFFGLILASVYFVGKTISKWSFSVIFLFIIGTAIAVTITLMTPATENPALWYLFICGIIAACCMILPGLSGSFILILLGNYQLVMINAINDLNIKILAPVVIGAGFGLLVFSHFLSWIFKKFKDQTISVLSGFILGSLAILWPWKNEITETFSGKIKVIGYNWNLPATLNKEVIFAIGFMILGVISIWLIEKLAEEKA